MVAGIDIRRAVPADAADIAVLIGQLSGPITARQAAERLEAVLGEPRGTVLVASGYGPLVGLVAVNWTRMLHHENPYARITALVVDEAARGSGIGRLLVKAASQAARMAGCDMLELTSRMEREAAHAFYRSIGFEHTSLRFSRSLRRKAGGA